MRSVTAWIPGLIGILCCMSALAAPPPSKSVDVRDLMSVTQFDQAGLNKLSPDEINAFNAWLNHYLNSRPTGIMTTTVSPPASAAAVTAASGVAGFGADTMTHKDSAETPKRIETRIAGMFTGWTGDTVFKLENGQVWQQAATGYFTDVKLDHPEVVIKKLTFGYLLTLPGQGETVFVRRIK